MTSPVARDLLAVPLFAELPEADRAFLATHLDALDFPAGQVLITEGRSNHTFFVLKAGSVEVRVPDKPVRTLFAGDFFGEISMDRRIPATATVAAKTAITAWVMSHAQFRAVRGNPTVLAGLRAAVEARLAANAWSLDAP